MQSKKKNCRKYDNDTLTTPSLFMVMGTEGNGNVPFLNKIVCHSCQSYLKNDSIIKTTIDQTKDISSKTESRSAEIESSMKFTVY